MISLFRITNIESSDKKFKLCFQFNSNNFNVVILGKNNAWISEMIWKDITELANKLQLQPEEYYSTLKEKLEGTPSNIDVKFNDSELIIYCKENKIKLEYFSCKVKKEEFTDCVFKLIDTVSSQNEELNQQNNKLLKEVNLLRDSDKKLKQELVQFVDKKKKDEKELLSNFVLVLNEKKRRIQHLNQTLHVFKAGRPVLNPQIKLKKTKKNVIKQEKDKISETDTSDSDDKDYGTDEEVKKDLNIYNDIPTRISKANFDNDLFLNDIEDPIHLPKRKKAKNICENFLNIPSTSACQNYSTSEKTEINLEDDSPKMSFNTQDLLDFV